MSNIVNTTIKRDETDTDMYHIYVITMPFKRNVKWLACSIHTDLLGVLTDEETYKDLKELKPGYEEFLDLQINLVMEEE